jgi:hypothetical protein
MQVWEASCAHRPAVATAGQQVPSVCRSDGLCVRTNTGVTGSCCFCPLTCAGAQEARHQDDQHSEARHTCVSAEGWRDGGRVWGGRMRWELWAVCRLSQGFPDYGAGPIQGGSRAGAQRQLAV